MKKLLFVISLIVMFILPSAVLAGGTSAVSTSTAGADAAAVNNVAVNPNMSTGANSSLSLTQTSPKADPGMGRPFNDTVILTLPSPVPWFGPFNSSWTSNIDFGGKEVFTKAELLEMGTAFSATINLDRLKKVPYTFENIRLVVLEPVVKDGKMYAPRVKVNGDGEVAGYIDGFATSKKTTLRKLLIEAMLLAMEEGMNCLVVCNYGNLFEVEAWSVGLSGGGSINTLSGDDKNRAIGGAIQGGTFFGKSKANAEPWFNGVALRVGKMANQAKVPDVTTTVATPTATKTSQELAKESDLSKIPTGTYDPKTMKK
jgi:hypothetical protein